MSVAPGDIRGQKRKSGLEPNSVPTLIPYFVPRLSTDLPCKKQAPVRRAHYLPGVVGLVGRFVLLHDFSLDTTTGVYLNPVFSRPLPNCFRVRAAVG